MKKFAGAIIAVAALVLCFTLSACANKYTSHYSATLMVRTNTSEKASVSFNTFSGTYVMKFKNKDDGQAFLTYNATLEEGSIKVYYDFNGEKLNLFEIGDNGSFEGETQTFTGNKTVYVILESDGKCNAGSFSFIFQKTDK